MKNDNVDHPERHNIGGSMNRPTRNEDPLSPRNQEATVDIGWNFFDDEVSEVLTSIHQMLLEKNKMYGNSALEPQRIFSQVKTVEQIKVRIDDKLSRMANLQPGDTEDTVMDLMGYLVLLRIAEKRLK